MAQDFRKALSNFQVSQDSLPIAHYSANGFWGTRFIIQQAERIHWFMGLRQAEIEVRAKEEALSCNRNQMRRGDRSLRRKRNRLKFLEQVSWLCPVWRGIGDEIEALEEEIDEIEQENARIEPLIRDALFEFRIASMERDRIRAEHEAELEGKSFEDLQRLYTTIAGLEGSARMIAAEVWAAQHNLPGSVGRAIADLSPDDRRYVLEREAELRLGLQAQRALVQAGEILEMLPEQKRNEAILMAAQMLAPEAFALESPHE